MARSGQKKLPTQIMFTKNMALTTHESFKYFRKMVKLNYD